MADNRLEPNRPRVGWYIDGLPDEVTPPTGSMLLDDGKRITLTIPFPSPGSLGQLERWFHGTSTRFGDDPDRTRLSYELPENLQFIDVDGPVGLVGCRVAGYQSNWGGASAGRGLIEVSAAVLGAGSLQYDRVNAMRTHIPELGAWMGLTSVEEVHHLDANSRFEGLDLSLASPGAVSLASRLNVSVIPTWRLERDAAHGPRQIHDESYVETRAARPRDWEEHLQVHQAVRELLNIATWQPFRYHQILVSRDDDPARTMDGDFVSERWCTVKTYALRANISPQGNPQYWFGYGHIGSTGFRRWLKLRDKYKRATRPMLSLVASSRSELIESRLNQSSISLEALGYQLALDAGKSESAARKLTYEARLEIIANAIPVSPVLPDWSRRAADAYNGVKHANRAMPATRDMLRVLLENTLTFRVWAAHRLGVPTTIVSSAVDIDGATQTLKHSL